jgi:hypothetical protein
MDLKARIAALKKLHAQKPGTIYFANDRDNPDKMVSYSHGDDPPWYTKPFMFSRELLLGKAVRITHPRSLARIATFAPHWHRHPCAPHPARSCAPHYPTR